ncbi:MAG: trypsin-like peptidase domain-containing protein [Luteolibacter sp.]
MSDIKMEEVVRAFTDAFDSNSLERMLRFQIGKRLDNIVAPGRFDSVVFDLLDVAIREGWEVQLIQEAHRFNPGNAQLSAVYEKYGIAPAIAVEKAGTPVPGPAKRASSAGLEVLLRENNPALDINRWRTRLSEVETRVCRVDVNGAPSGTGFLIGKDLVLTNYHVVMNVLKSGHPSSVSCLFDYKILTDGSCQPGIRLGLAAGAGILLYEPCSQMELASRPQDPPPPTTDQLDFALLQLARPIGDEPLSVPGSPRRGWETLPDMLPRLLPDEGLIIAQHPMGEPMKLAIDTQSVIDVNANETRVRYRTNTQGGSSGSAVFNMLWELVALHHLGDPARNDLPGYNQGVLPLNLIRDKITAAGFGPLLG